MINIDKNMPDEQYSMLSEIERELRLRFDARDNLPGKPLNTYNLRHAYIYEL